LRSSTAFLELESLIRALVSEKKVMPFVSQIDDIKTRGDEIRTQLRALLYRHEYPGNAKNLVLVAYVDIALEHYAAICFLTKAGLHGSAFALVRSVFDTMLRAYWINKVATEQQIEQAISDELNWRRIDVLADVKKAYFDKPALEAAERAALTELEAAKVEAAKVEAAELAELAKVGDKFFKLIKEAWPALCSYTHSGGLQIGRRFTGDNVKPNYGEAAIVQAFNSATVALLLLLHMFFVSMRHYKEVAEVQTLLRQHHGHASKRRMP
jgi:hypothetical protein